MAQIEPLDVENDFEDKENLLQHSNVLPRTPCPEKGYEELDVSELGMKLRYSTTPASSPMSKSYTANCRDNKHYEAIDDSKNLSVFNSNNLTHSLNSSLKLNESLSSKVCPLQSLPTDLQNPLRRSMDMHPVDTGITFSFSENHTEEDSLLPSPSSSANLTPEATTPTKDVMKDGGSPILRGLKSVFSMFRSSQSPIPPTEVTSTPYVLSPTTETSAANNPIPQPSLISTPILKTKETSSKRNSPLKESLTFKDDLEKELLWKEESTIIFKDEKIPIHKLFLQQPLSMQMLPTQNKVIDAEKDMSVEYMDISQNNLTILDATMTDLDAGAAKSFTDIINHVESDGEFVDCETTFTKNDSLISNPVEELVNENQTIIATEQLNEKQTNNKEVLETNQVLNEIMAVNHDSTMEVIKNIDSSIEMLTANQSRDNRVTVDLSVMCDNNIKDHMPDLVNIPIAISTTSIDVTSTSNYINKVDTNVQRNDTFEYSSEAICSLNREAFSTSQMNSNEKNTDVTKHFNIRESINNVFDTPIRECEAMDVSEDNSKIIADLSSLVDETFEIITKDNGAISSLDNKEEQNDCSHEQSIIDKYDVKLRISSTDINLAPDIIANDSLKTCGTEPPKLCTIDNEKKEAILSDVNRVKEASKNDASSEKEEMMRLEDNHPSQILHQEMESKSEQSIIDKYDVNLMLPSTDSNLTPDISVNNSLKTCSTVPAKLCTVDNENKEVIISDIDTVKEASENDASYEKEDIVRLEDNQQCQILHQKMESKFEQSIIDKYDVNIMIPSSDSNLAPDISVNNSLKAYAIEPAKLSIIDNEKKEAIISDIDRVKEASDNDMSFKKEEIMRLEDNQKCLILHQEMKSYNDTDIINSCNLSFSEKDSNTILVEKENTIIPESIPLPCDTDIKQELVTDFKSIINDSKTELHGVSDINDLQCTESQADYVNEESKINKSIKQNIPETTICEIDKEISNNLIEHTHNDIQVPKCEILNRNLDNIDDKLNICDKHIVKSTANFVSQLTNEDAFDIEKNKALGSLDIKLCVNEKGNNIFSNSTPNNTSENVNLPFSLNSENDSTTIDIVQNDQVKYDEEIITSASSSPYVSVTDMTITSLAQDKDNVDNIENPFQTKNKIDKSPPISPLPSNKGYNFNFDDIQDPFATKTKIRLSPTPQSSPLHENKNSKLSDSRRKDFHKNKRKSHPEKGKKYFTNTKTPNKINSNRILVEYQSDDNEKSLFDNEKIKITSLSTENIDKNRKEVNIEINTEVTLSKVTSDSATDDVGLKKYENEHPLCETNNKTQEIELPIKEIAVDNMTLPKFHNTEVFDNINSIKTNFNSELKENDDQKDDIKTYSESLFKEEVSKYEINEFDHIENTLYKFQEHNINVESNNGNEIDATLEFAKTFPAELAIEKSILEVKIEKNNYEKENDTAMTNSALSPPPSACEVFVDSTIEVTSDTELKQYEEKSFSVISEKSTSDFNNATCVLKNTEADQTLTEVHTEDEDTIEGPFLDVDGFSDHQKVKNFDSNLNMMEFDFPPVAENDDNIDNGELFIDAEAFEFLLNQNKTNVITNSGKESLFLKFDPLYSKRISSDNVLTAMSKIKKRHSTPIKSMQATNEDLQTATAQPSSSKTGVVSDDYRDDPDVSSMSKPMMVVNPAVNPVVSPRKVTPIINRRSLAFTSPAIAVIDRLLCLNGNTSFASRDMGHQGNDTDIAITQLRELLAEKEIHVHDLRSESKELTDRLASLETQMKSLETESEKRLKKVNDLNECLVEKTKINRSMAVVVEEYERTIASLITEMEQEKKRNGEERNILIKERDEQTSHLASMEVSFNDLHSKYEKSKQIILSMKSNEDTYKKSIKDFEENLVKMQNNYELLKQHATSKLNHANQELEKFNKSHESEVLKLNAMIKRKEMHITSLEETLAQKTKANEELAAICDELINKVG